MLAALLAAPLALRAQNIEVIELRHRSAEQLLPLLRPLIEPAGAISGRGYQLYLRTTPAMRRQLLDLLHSLDTPARRLSITVRHDTSDDRRRERHGTDGSLTIGTRGIDPDIGVVADNTRHLSTRQTMQSVSVLEGASAYIAVGMAIPMAFHQWVATPQGLTEVRGTAYYDALTGFYVRPRLAGDEVTLELAPEESMLAAGGIERARLSTTVRGRLREWIAVGGADVQAEVQAGGALPADHVARSSRRGVWLKVDPADAQQP